MDSKRSLAISGTTIAILLLTAFSTVESSRTRTPELTKFLILIQNTDSGLKLTCHEGCAWKELAFSLKPHKFQAVDPYGMTSINRDKPSKDDNLSDFLFTIERTESGIDLEGKEGTAWTRLKFTCPNRKCNQYIDQHGMTSKE